MNAPANGLHHEAFDALFPTLKENAPESRSRFAPPSPIGPNGADSSAAPSPIGPIGRYPTAPPSPIGPNGADPSARPSPIGPNGSPLDPRPSPSSLAPPSTPPSPVGVNGRSATDSATRKSPTGRGSNGRFTAGNHFGPGNPFARRTAQLRQAFCEAVSAEEMKALSRVLLDKAKGGDLAAAKLLLEYVVGRPAPVVDPDTLDFQEWQHFQQVPARPDAVHRVLNCLPSGLACSLIRILLPNTERQIREIWLNKIETDERKEASKLRRKARRSAKPTPTNNPNG
jgi:hypothetical protein